MTNQNFPGNPYDSQPYLGDANAQAVARAVRLLAFEQRTANLIAAARPSDLTGLTPEQHDRVISANTEARERLGRAPVVEEPPVEAAVAIVVTFPRDPNISEEGIQELARRFSGVQDIYPIEFRR